MAAKAAGIELVFKGQGESEVGMVRSTGRVIVRVNPRYYRPAEVDLLIGNPEKATRELGWKPTTTLEQLCEMMVQADLRRNEAGFSF